MIMLITTTMSRQPTSAWVCLLQGNERLGLESKGRDNPKARCPERTRMTSALLLAQMFLTSKTAHKFPAALDCSYLRGRRFIYDRVRWSCALRTVPKKPGKSTISYRTANHGHLVLQNTNKAKMDQGNILSLGVLNRKLCLAHFCVFDGEIKGFSISIYRVPLTWVKRFKIIYGLLLQFLEFLLKTPILSCLLRGYVSCKLGNMVKSLESRIPVVQQRKVSSMRTEIKGERFGGDRRDEGRKKFICVDMCVHASGNQRANMVVAPSVIFTLSPCFLRQVSHRPGIPHTA